MTKKEMLENQLQRAKKTLASLPLWRKKAIQNSNNTEIEMGCITDIKQKDNVHVNPQKTEAIDLLNEHFLAVEKLLSEWPSIKKSLFSK
jgi:hypothetical protein